MKCAASRCVLASVLLLGGAPLAEAADYWYALVGLGYGKVEFYPADFASINNNPQIGPADSETIRDSDLGFTGALGVQLNRNWAVELNFIQLGKFSYKYTFGANTQESVYEVSGWGVSLLPTVPLTRNFSLFGRLGVLAAQTRLTLKNPAQFGPVAGQPLFDGTIQAVQVSTTSFLSGFGAQYFVNRDFGIRIEYQNLGAVGTAKCGSCTGRANAQFLSGNAIFTF